MDRAKRLFTLLVLSSLLFGLSACSIFPCGQQIGASTPFRSNIWQRHNCKSLVNELRARGVHVVVVGDTTRMIFPSDRFFKVNSIELKPCVLGTVSIAAAILRHCGTSHIVITGHTDNMGGDRHRQALSEEQARVFATEFWNAGISWNRMTVHGLADDVQIATDRTVFGSADNRRVEVRIEEKAPSRRHRRRRG